MKTQIHLFSDNFEFELRLISAMICLVWIQDVVILNKVDLISQEHPEGTLESLEKEIHKINSLANIIHSVRCQVDLSKILDCYAYDATVSYIWLLSLAQ